jgi:putative glutamine amidotransferase
VDYGTGPEPENQNEIVARIIQQGNALLLSGGGDVDPSFYRSSEPAKKVNIRRDTFELALIEEAMKHRMPIMGICRGCQLLNVALGGTLQTIRNREEYRRYHNRFRTHPVTIEPDSRLYQTVKAKHLPVRSLHGQAVDRVGEGLRIIARANDGLPEAIENTPSEEGHWMVGVQWHPELMPFKNQEHLLMDEFSHQARQFILDTRSAQ